MKKCSFCFEEIQEEAIKCRFCHENLTKLNTKSVFDVLNSTKGSLLNKYYLYQDKKNENLQVPTDENGWVLGDTEFFGTILNIRNVGHIKYEKIIGISFKPEAITRNFSTDRKVIFGVNIYAEEENGQLTDKILGVSLLLRDIKFLKVTKNAFEKILLIYNHIAKVTFKNRLNFYKNQLDNNGYFHYMNHKFHTDGRIYNNNKIVANLNGLDLRDISFSSEWSGLKSSQQNPYEFKILNGLPQVNLFFGLFQSGQSFKIDTYTDNDIFNFMIFNFIKNNHYI